MGSFTKKLLLYLLPLLLVVICFEIYFWKDKEIIPINTVIEKQLNSKNEVYFLREFFSSAPLPYKIQMAERKKADILVVGQSTVLQFRDFMFHPYEKSFYNMGKSISNLNELESLITLMENKAIHKPRVMILGFDLSLIKTNYFGSQLNTIMQPFKDEVYDFKYHFSSIQMSMRNFTKKEKSITQNRGLGYGYWGSKGTGFRKDGSMHYGETIAGYLKNGEKKKGDQYKGLVNTGGFIFTKPYILNPACVARFFAVTEKIKKLNIELLVYVPPYSDDFYSFISTKKDLKSCFDAYLALQNTFKQKHIKTIEFTTPEKMGLNDAYMLDSIHPGEVYVGIALYNYLSSIGKHDFLATIDKAFLKKQLDAKSTNVLSFMHDVQVFPNNHYQ